MDKKIFKHIKNKISSSDISIMIKIMCGLLIVCGVRDSVFAVTCIGFFIMGIEHGWSNGKND